ncbi:uncharacterized protein ACWYII_032737 isoform 1-T1 [Salvelinus alpinus]
MKTSLVLLALGLLACSVHGQEEVDTDNDHKEVEHLNTTKPSTDLGKDFDEDLEWQELSWSPLCGLCKELLTLVKKALSSHPTKEEIKLALLVACDALGPASPVCMSMVNMWLDVLIDELLKHIKVRPICVKIHACKPKNVLDWRNRQNMEKQSDNLTDASTLTQQPFKMPTCWVCKTLQTIVKNVITSCPSSRDDIKLELTMACDELGPLSPVCKDMAETSFEVLLKELTCSHHKNNLN